jgi:hypothetical protein
MTHGLRSIFLMMAFTLSVGPGLAFAVPILAIDLDPVTPGIQSLRTVSLGASVDVEVVYTGDGTSTFDAVSLDVFFNSGGPVASPGSPEVRDIALHPNVFDTFSFALPPPPLVPGDALVSLFSVGSTSLGGVGIYTTETSFPVFGAGFDVSLFRTSFLAIAVGTTAISVDTIFPGDFLLALDNLPVAVQLAGADLNVRSTAVPEPASLSLILLGGLALCARKRASGRESRAVVKPPANGRRDRPA